MKLFKRSALALIIIGLLSRALGFIRQIVLAYFYGASYLTDAYLISLVIPMSIFSIIGIGISTTFIPIYVKTKKEKSDVYSLDFMNKLINLSIFIISLFLITTLIFTKEIIYLISPGFDYETQTIAVNFTRISLFSMYFYALIYIFKSFLNIKGVFKIPALIGIPLNLVIITFIILSQTGNIYFLSLGTLFGSISQFIFLIPFVYKNGYKFKPTFKVKSPEIKKMILLSVPVIISSSVDQVNVIIDKNIASTLTVGGVSALTYSSNLSLFVQGVFVLSILTILYPEISKYIFDNKKTENETLHNGLVTILFFIIPIATGFILLSKEIITTLFFRGAFDETALNLTTGVLTFYSIGFISIALRELINKFFYAREKNNITMYLSFFTVALNIFLNFYLSNLMGINGLALASSIAITFNVIILIFLLKYNLKINIQKKTIRQVIKIIFSTLLMTLTIIILKNIIIIDNIIIFGFVIIIGFLIYLLSNYMLRLDLVMKKDNNKNNI